MEKAEGDYYVERIKSIANINNTKKYLEIGVETGKTFFPLQFDLKVAVDPDFKFSVEENKKENESYFEITSDNFFKALSENDPIIKYENIDNSIKFDLIFIDGLHTFEQSFRDFKNSLAFSHENTIWIIDDTGPHDPYSALPDQKKSDYYKSLAGILDEAWQGDVYKTIFAIHDYYPDFSYCTIQDKNLQTILWRKPGGNRKPFFSSMEEIDYQSFFDLLDKIDLLHLVSFEQAMTAIGKEFVPTAGRPLLDQHKWMVGPIMNVSFVENLKLREIVIAYNESIQNQVNEMQNTITLLEMERDRARAKCLDLEAKIKAYER